MYLDMYWTHTEQDIFTVHVLVCFFVLFFKNFKTSEYQNTSALYLVNFKNSLPPNVTSRTFKRKAVTFISSSLLPWNSGCVLGGGITAYGKLFSIPQFPLINTTVTSQMPGPKKDTNDIKNNSIRFLRLSDLPRGRWCWFGQVQHRTK